MLDALPASERTSAPTRRGPPATIDPDAYDEWAPALYVYRLRRGDDEHVGVWATSVSEAFVDGQVRGHEAVQPERVEALVEHFSSVAVRSELVALLHRPGPAVEAALAESVGRRPLLRFTGPDGWEQTVWRVPATATDAWSRSSAAACTTSPTGTTASPPASTSGARRATRPTRESCA